MGKSKECDLRDPHQAGYNSVHISTPVSDCLLLMGLLVEGLQHLIKGFVLHLLLFLCQLQSICAPCKCVPSLLRPVCQLQIYILTGILSASFQRSVTLYMRYEQVCRLNYMQLNERIKPARSWEHTEASQAYDLMLSILKQISSGLAGVPISISLKEPLSCT